MRPGPTGETRCANILQSLDKILPYEIDWVLPGHRAPFQNHRRRIAELKEHHEIRTEEVATILRRGSRTAYQVASEMTWDIDCESWEDFPLPQKWFAGEKPWLICGIFRDWGASSGSNERGSIISGWRGNAKKLLRVAGSGSHR